MEIKVRRRLPALIAAGVIAGGLAAPATPVAPATLAALAADTNAAADPVAVYKKAAGKYEGKVVEAIRFW